MLPLVGFVGFAGSGKDTAAQVLVASGWQTIAFADALKDAVASIFGWQRDMLEGATDESRLWREQVDEWWAKRLDMPHLTPRWVLRNFGTEVMRQHFHPEIWVARVEQEILMRRRDNPRVQIVLTDMRFPDEIDLCRRYDGKIVRVRRGDDPGWIVHGIGAALGDAGDALLLNDLGVHPSEWKWLGVTPHVTVENDGDIPKLHARVVEALR